jgi:cytochrome c2
MSRAVAIALLAVALPGCHRADPHEPLPITADVGEGLYALKRCSSCHAIDGKGGRIGCDLSRVALRRDKDWMTRWLKDPQAVRPGTRMPDIGLSEDEAAAIAEYLATRR